MNPTEKKFSVTRGERKRNGLSTTQRSLARTACAARLLLLLLLLLALPAAVQAQCFNYITNNDTITITGYICSKGDVTIPDTIDGLPVTGIGNWAFYNCGSLATLKIGTNVTSIGSGAIFGCWNLTNVLIPNSVTNIGNVAFHMCISLPSVTIPNSVISIGGNAFGGCTSLTNISVDPANDVYCSVTGTLFSKNQTVLIAYPAGRTGGYTIPDSVTSIGDTAFYWCSSLTGVTISANVTNIGYGVFPYCFNMTAITVDASNAFYSSVNGILFNKSQTTLIQCPGGKIGGYAIPNGVTSIGSLAFAGCTKLTGVTIPSSVTIIGDDRPFYQCESLMTITVNASNAVYGSLDGVLFNKGQTTLIEYPGGKAGDYTIPNGVTSIGVGAFSACFNLTSVIIPSSVSSIGDWAFFACGSLNIITIPGSITSIGDYTFSTCSSLTSVTIPRSVTSIGGWAFNSCTSLTNVTIPKQVTNIGDRAFGDCTSLMGIYFWGNAPGLGLDVFSGTDNATVYHLPGTISWDTTLGGRPTAIWALPFPVILDTGPSFGVQTTAFGFTLSWATNIPVVVEAATNLASPVWAPVGTNTLTNGSAYFSDPGWTNHLRRFYRLRSP